MMLHPSVQTFITVAECGSFNSAAERLLLSPTAVTKQIRGLEDRTGITLFCRTHHGLTLTPAGRILLDEAIHFSDYAARAIEHARSAQDAGLHTVRIGSSYLYPVTRALKLYDTVSNKLPDLTLEIVQFQESAHGHYFDELKNDFDLIYASYDDISAELAHPNLRFLEADKTNFCIAISKKHRLSKKQSVSYSDLSGEHLMMMQRGISPINDLIRDDIELHHPDITIKTIKTGYNIELFNHFVRSNDILLSLDIWKSIHPNLVHVPLDVPYSIPCGFNYYDPPTPATAMFLNAIRECMDARLPLASPQAHSR